jgi:hypothetical protein
MALDALLDLRDRLRSDVPLEEFFIAHYGKPAKHLVGYKRSPNANDYPFVAYVPVKMRNKDISKAELISVIIGVNEKEIVDDVMLGHVRVAEAVDLLEPIINEGVIAPKTIILNDYEVTPDFGERHPFYETEIQLKLMRRQK